MPVHAQKNFGGKPTMAGHAVYVRVGAAVAPEAKGAEGGEEGRGEPRGAEERGRERDDVVKAKRRTERGRETMR